jgi:hypothetical protein
LKDLLLFAIHKVLAGVAKIIHARIEAAKHSPVRIKLRRAGFRAVHSEPEPVPRQKLALVDFV